MLQRNLYQFHANEVITSKVESFKLLNEVKNAVLIQESAVERMVKKCKSYFRIVMPVVDTTDGMEIKWIGIK